MYLHPNLQARLDALPHEGPEAPSTVARERAAYLLDDLPLPTEPLPTIPELIVFEKLDLYS